MALLILFSLFVLVLVFHVEFDTMRKYLVDNITEKFEELKLEKASRSYCIPGDDDYEY